MRSQNMHGIWESSMANRYVNMKSIRYISSVQLFCKWTQLLAYRWNKSWMSQMGSLFCLRAYVCHSKSRCRNDIRTDVFDFNWTSFWAFHMSSETCLCRPFFFSLLWNFFLSLIKISSAILSVFFFSVWLIELNFVLVLILFGFCGISHRISSESLFALCYNNYTCVMFLP